MRFLLYEKVDESDLKVLDSPLRESVVIELVVSYRGGQRSRVCRNCIRGLKEGSFR